ncbi:YncE family protein [Flavivirga algicola]|uniref:Uncharacterized protein n=1 Tax=Flavivirga algicola TaxID=2729136 RepID=A0ABX1RWY3_9FLAO|nr:hypothetical protein [Flavivirga algicola]NMH86845.1 hypothetical protein [Flavivirga algicola]
MKLVLKMYKKYVFLSIAFMLFLIPSNAQEFKVVKTYEVQQAKQGVAVDGDYFYVVNNSNIVKYTRKASNQVKQWKDTSGAIKHLNSGIIINGKLYCTNSNYPESPMASSIEIFDPETLMHIDNVSLGIYIGSATWLDFYNGYWYVAFAHYTGRGSSEGKTNSWTQLVKFTKDWQRIEGWVFPKILIGKFGTRSNSGGFITKEGTIYATGHDDKELYKLKFPKIGHTLIWKNTYSIPYEGQGIALDASTEKSLTLFGIIKKDNKVIQTILKK